MKDKDIKWQKELTQEHELRLQAEQKASAAETSMQEAQDLLKKASGFNNYLESKYYDLEASYAEQQTKFTSTVEMLKKAKQLILQRKNELLALKEENAKLKSALAKKAEVLELEMIQHEQTNHKLALTLRKLADVQSADINIHEVPADKLEEYFTYKILNTHKNETVTTQTLQADTDFLAQLRYIEEQYTHKT